MLKTPQTRPTARIKSFEAERIDAESRPVSVSDVKLWCKIDFHTDDTLFDPLIEAARNAWEKMSNRAMFETKVTAIADAEVPCVIDAPIRPVRNVESVKRSNGDDVDFKQFGDKIEINAIGEITIEYTAYQFEVASDVDGDTKLGCYKYVLSNYDDRQDISASAIYTMPNSSETHWSKYRDYRF